MNNRVLINGLLINDQNTGIGNYGYNLINTLSENIKDYNVSVLCQQDIKFNNINMIHKNYTSNYKRILAEQIMLLKEFNKYDLIHFIDYSSPLIKIKKPFIVTIHDLSYYKYPETFTYGSRKIKKIIAPYSIKNATRIIADSNNTKKDILSMFNVNEEKIKVIYPGRPNYQRIEDINEIKKVKRKYRISGEYILYLGTLEPRKNILSLIDAYYNLIKEEISENLVIAGKKGWLYSDIFEKVNHLKLSDRIIFVGFVDEKDKPALYSGAKVFIYPSLYEGFGLPPLEAMTCGTPVIASRTSSLPEVIEESGIYINPRDINSISQALYDLIKNKNLRNKLKELGIKRSRFFDWKKTVEQVLEVYNEILR
jgi:glycosyltransferase involved in cell wall biosynthesis